MTHQTRRSFVLGVGYAAASFLSRPSVAAESGPAVPQAPSDIRALIDAERQTILATMERDDIQGAAICFVHDGKLAWLEGFGVTDKQSRRPADPSTIFSIQSTSKNFTATAIMLAVQRGLLKLDEPITTYLPDFTVNSRFESRPEKSMTLRLLLSHRAGFTHEAAVGSNYDDSTADFDAHVRSISQTWLRCPVNDRYRYSNLGFDLAGYVLQTVCGKPFSECLRTMLFEPLGMHDSTSDSHDYAKRANRAVGHMAGHERVPLAIPIVPSGGVYVSARDMARYVLFHLNKGRIDGKTLLNEERWNEMHAFAFPGAYSLGVAGGLLRFGETDVSMLLHSGGGYGFGCMFRFYPQARLGWALLFNRMAGQAYGLGNTLIDEILVRRYGPRTPRITLDTLPSTTLSQSALQAFVGNWRGRGYSCDLKLVEGSLVMKQGKEQVPIRIVSPDRVAFPPDRPGGDASELRYFREGKTTPHLEPLLTDNHFDYNDGPNDPPGPDKPEWENYVGDYVLDRWGKPLYPIKVQRKNGYLYIDAVRIVVEHERGLFFTSDGEAVDFRAEPVRWGNIALRRRQHRA
jgi:CubicO group peptidase (beta-lactamase class C family)